MTKPDSPKWLTKLGTLNPAISRHKLNGKARYAPHKPLLLLCAVDLAESGELRAPELGNTPELCLRFDSYWALVQERWGGRPVLTIARFRHPEVDRIIPVLPLRREQHPNGPIYS